VPRTCLACSSPERGAIEKALVAGEPLRNIAKRVSISPAGLLRHKRHVAQAIVMASERREEILGDNLLEEMRRVQRKAWQLLAKTESEGDHRASIVALREVRECLESLGMMLARAGASNGSRLALQQVLDARKRAGLANTKITVRFVGPGDKPSETLVAMALREFCREVAAWRFRDGSEKTRLGRQIPPPLKVWNRINLFCAKVVQVEPQSRVKGGDSHA
jgi:hypothetical protein